VEWRVKTKGEKMKYSAAKGSRLSDEQAQMFGERIEILQEEYNGEVTPDVLLEDAKGIDSPLHNWFEWDDTNAARAYRRQQAYYLLRSIHVVVQVNDEEMTTRAFHHVTIQETEPERDEGDGMHQEAEVLEPESRRVYVSIQRIVTDADLRQQIIEDAMHQLQSWRRRYQQYTELAQIFGAIDAIQGTLEMAPEVETIAA
jgi:hypothetical protein